MRIDFDATDVARLEAAMAHSPEIVQQELRAFVAGATAHLQAEVQERTPTTHGTLRASILGEVRVLPAFGVEGVVGTSLAYAVPVELGSKAHMPPVEPLVEWAKQKLGVRGKDAVSAAWGVAKKIAARGVDGVFMFRDSLRENERQIVEGFGECVNRIAARIEGSV